MQIESIEINNFRCLKSFTIKIAPKVTVLIGKNGAGKTSLLSALKYALSVFFTNDKSIGDNMMAAGNPDLHIIKTESWDFYRDKNNNDQSSIDLSIKVSSNLYGKDLEWEYYKRSTSFASLYSSKYKDAYVKMMEEYRDSGKLPVFVYYSDCFPHKDSRMSDFARKSIMGQGYMQRNFGFYKWDEDASCTTMWQNRLANSLIFQKTTNIPNAIIDEEVAYVCKKLIEFSDSNNQCLNDDFSIETVFPKYDGEKIYLFLSLKNGNEVMFAQLPAGYGRLYSIVLDLAYRMFVLKRGLDYEPQGVVMIDEIDLHLHPSLEQEVIGRLTDTFHGLQFIVSTHSPSVLTRLKTKDTGCIIYKMREDKAVELNDLYGADFTSTIYGAMETPLVQNEIKEEIDAIVRLTRKGKSHLAENRKSELKKIVSDAKYDQLMEEIGQRLKQTI